MPFSLIDILLALPTYALVLFRLGGLMLTAPVLGSQAMPRQIRIGMTMVIGAMIFPLVETQAPPELTLGGALVGGLGEMAIGASIGLALSLFLLAAEVAGLMVGRQAGLALGEVFDPALNEQRSLAGQIYAIVLVLVFLTVGGHRAMMAALLDTYQVIPLLSFRYDETPLLLLVEMLTAAFMLGIRLAGPVLIALFMTSTALSFLSRTMPQFNILSVGFPVRILVALSVAGMAITACQDLLVDEVWAALELVRLAFGLE